MFALMNADNTAVIRTTSEQSFEWRGFTYSNAYLLTAAERAAAGIFDFVSLPVSAPEGTKVQGTALEIGDGVVTETPVYVDKTPAELTADRRAKYTAAVAARAAAYRSDLAALHSSWTSASASGGLQEADKKAAIHDDIETARVEYVADVASLKAQYL